jgi:hypothetical protein
MLLHVLVVPMLKQKGSVNNLGMVWRRVYFVILAVWDAAMIYYAFVYLLGSSIPEFLGFPEFFVAGAGFSSLYDMPINDRKDAGKGGTLIISTTRLIMGGTALFTGVYAMMYKKPNPFTYLCILIGIALISLNVKRAIIKDG